MTRAEMTEIFALLAIEYPNAETFKALDKETLIEKLAPKITLWTACLQDMDFWTAQKAVLEVIKTCKFPPNAAEMRQAAETVIQETQSEIATAYLMTRNAVITSGGDLKEAYERMSARSRKVINAMGGMEKFSPVGGKMFNAVGFERTYERLLRQNPLGLPGNTGEQRKLI